jgi:hypothetical protein
MNAYEDTSEALDIERLNYGAVDSQSRSFDFSQPYDYDCDGVWRISEDITSRCGEESCPNCERGHNEEDCERCKGEGVDSDNEACIHCDGDGTKSHECDTCEGTGDADLGDHEAWHPMMNNVWPIPSANLGDDFRETLCNMTVVEIEDGDEYLALTGGGMDLSWAVAETFIRLGYYPPAAVRLPRMCGRGLSRKDRSIIEACKVSAQTQIGWMQSRIEDLDDIAPSAERRIERNALAQEGSEVD